MSDTVLSSLSPARRDWRAAAKIWGNRLTKAAWLFNLAAGLHGSAAFVAEKTVAATTYQFASLGIIIPDAGNMKPTRSLDMAGYREKPEYYGTEHQFSGAQEKYLKDSADLLNTIESCRSDPAACHPNIRAFAKMLDQVKFIPDKLTQVEVINAWINMYVDYDHKEARLDITDLEHHTLKTSLIFRRGICDEQARLKLFALETIGFASDDVRWVSERVYEKGVYNSGHAIVLVRIGEQQVIMGNQTPRVEPHRELHKPIVGPVTAAFLIDDAAEMDTDLAQLNISKASRISNPDYAFIPRYSFNSHIRADYNVKLTDKLSEAVVSGQVKNAPAEIADLHFKHIIQKPGYGGILEIMKPALAVRYKVAWDDFKPAAPPYTLKVRPMMALPN